MFTASAAAPEATLCMPGLTPGGCANNADGPGSGDSLILHRQQQLECSNDQTSRRAFLHTAMAANEFAAGSTATVSDADSAGTANVVADAAATAFAAPGIAAADSTAAVVGAIAVAAAAIAAGGNVAAVVVIVMLLLLLLAVLLQAMLLLTMLLLVVSLLLTWRLVLLLLLFAAAAAAVSSKLQWMLGLMTQSRRNKRKSEMKQSGRAGKGRERLTDQQLQQLPIACHDGCLLHAFPDADLGLVLLLPVTGSDHPLLLVLPLLQFCWPCSMMCSSSGKMDSWQCHAALINIKVAYAALPRRHATVHDVRLEHVADEMGMQDMPMIALRQADAGI